MELSVIIPAHNEAIVLGSGPFHAALCEIRKSYPDCQIIIVDDGSSDHTGAIAKTLADRVIQQPHSGKATALIAGINAAEGHFVLWSDADWSVPPSIIPALLNPLRGDADLSIASRGYARKDSPAFRWIGSGLFSLACQEAFDWSFTDTQCGLKAATRSALCAIIAELRLFAPTRIPAYPSTDALFDVECLLVARQLGLKVAAIPAPWIHRPNRSKVDFPRLLKTVVRDFHTVRRAYRNGSYQPWNEFNQ